MQIPGGLISPTCSSGVETMFFSFPLTTVAPKSQYISIRFLLKILVRKQIKYNLSTFQIRPGDAVFGPCVSSGGKTIIF